MLHKKSFERRAGKIIAALISCPTVEAAAQQAKCAPSTIFRYLADSLFQCKLRAARKQGIDTAVSRLSGLANEAVHTLHKHLSNGTAAIEIKAAVAILSHLKSLTGDDDLESRLAELESQLVMAAEASA